MRNFTCFFHWSIPSWKLGSWKFQWLQHELSNESSEWLLIKVAKALYDSESFMHLHKKWWLAWITIDAIHKTCGWPDIAIRHEPLFSAPNHNASTTGILSMLHISLLVPLKFCLIFVIYDTDQAKQVKWLSSVIHTLSFWIFFFYNLSFLKYHYLSLWTLFCFLHFSSFSITIENLSGF